MSLFEMVPPSKALSDLLEKEHSAILKSQFATLASLSASKIALMKSVARSNATQNDLERLKTLSERNSKLLAASAEGLKSARQSLSRLRAPHPAFQTYDPSGTRLNIDNKPLTIKKKM